MHDVLSLARDEIKRFLERTLPDLGSEWWKQHVVGRLTFAQQRLVTERGIDTLDGLDLAALLRVLDQNWYEFTSRVTLPREARSWIRELQTVRNKWAHASSQVVPASETYRDVDTIGRLLGALGATTQTPIIETKKAELLRALASQTTDNTPGLESTADSAPTTNEQLTLFRVGELVAMRSNPATILPVIEILSTPGTESRYRVFQDGSIATYYERQLQAIAQASDAPVSLTAPELRAYLTSLHLTPPSTHQLYSLRAGRINFVPYQYRPVMKLIRADRPRLLIADEVGVGKTIEAGLILKELRARMDLQSVIVICPKALVSEKKWYREMKRFDEHFVALDGASLRHCIEETHNDGEWPAQFARAILPMSLLDHDLLDGTEGRGRHRKGLRELEPPPRFDLVIVDEAHHIRNPETATHQAVRVFCENAQAVVFLTATPLQLGTPDYFALLNVLRPDLIRDAASFALMSEPNPFLHEAVMACRTAKEGWADRARSLLDEAAGTDWGRTFLRERPEFQKAYDDLGERVVTDATRVSLIRRIEELGSFSTLINRTRRRDIGAFTTRKPHTEPVEFTPEQQTFHDRLLTVIASILAARHGDQNVKFLMTTIRRQAASCLFGLAPLLEDILRRNIDRLELLETTDDDREMDISFLDSIQTEIASLCELANRLDPYDPKVEAFLTAIREKQLRTNNKLLVFTTFRHTLAYLERNLAKEIVRIGAVHGNVPDEDRAELRRRFSLPREDANALDVLLSTEVGSEGLDVQFCDYLVNYDLPWNPMKIEQRIGRLDRYGQKSESIVILNLITPGTVDADIFERCLLRIGVFEHAIGGSEAILGEITKKLHDIADRFELTAEERQRQLQQMADNDIRRLQAQAELEIEQERFFGLDVPQEWERDLEAADSAWLSPAAIEHCVTRYLASRTGAGHDMLLGEGQTKTLRLSQEARAALAVDFAKLARSTDTATRDWESWLKGGSPTLAVTFAQVVAAETPSVTYLTLTHPLVRQSAAHASRTAPAYVDLTVRSSATPSGEYRFGLYRWSLHGVRTDETLVAVADRPEFEDHLLPLLLHAEEPSSPCQLSSQEFDALDARHHEKWAAAQGNHAAENRQLVEFRVQSLNASHAARLHAIRDQLARTSNEKIQKMKESELASADADYHRHLAELERAASAGDIHATAVLFGMIRVTA